MGQIYDKYFQIVLSIAYDFEKAYDRVNWDFMEGTLLRMGFPNRWIRGVSTLYRNAHNFSFICKGCW